MNDNKLVTGWQLYDMHIAGDPQKDAVKQLMDGIMAGIAGEPALPVRNTVKRISRELLIEGSIVVVDGEVAKGVVLFIERTPVGETAYQLLPDGNALKVWRKVGELVLVMTYAKPQSLDSIEDIKRGLKDSTPLTSASVDAKGVTFVDNDRGVLYPGRDTLGRIQELTGLLSNSISDTALRWYVSSLAADVSMLNAAYNGSGPFGTLPDGAKFEHMYDTAYTSDIFKQLDRLLPAFRSLASNFTIVPNESGVARYLGMIGYINMVRNTQAITAGVMLEGGETVSFENVVFSAVSGEIAPTQTSQE